MFTSWALSRQLVHELIPSAKSPARLALILSPWPPDLLRGDIDRTYLDVPLRRAIHVAGFREDYLTVPQAACMARGNRRGLGLASFSSCNVPYT